MLEILEVNSAVGEVAADTAGMLRQCTETIRDAQFGVFERPTVVLVHSCDSALQSRGFPRSVDSNAQQCQ